jgi:hypothetical protein
MFSGLIANPLSVLEDYSRPTETAANLFQRVHARGGRAVVFDPFMLGAYGAWCDAGAHDHRIFRFGEYRELTEDTFAQASAFLRRERWDLAVVPFYTMDYVGHLETPRAPVYREMVRLLDDRVRQLVALAGENDTVLIASEHGMNDHGFHTDRDPMVIDTPFVLMGKGVRRGGERRLLQLDWAPTLSILAGVSPFYPSLGVPALDVLDLPEADDGRLLRAFGRLVCGRDDLGDLPALRAARAARLRVPPSRAAGALPAGAALAGVALLGVAALWPVGRENGGRRVLWAAAAGAAAIAVGTVAAAGLLDRLHVWMPFRADLMRARPLPFLALLAAAAGTGRLLRRAARSWSPAGRRGAVLVGAIVFFGLVFASGQPYHALNWAVVCVPLFAWGVSGQSGWLVLFGGLWLGLAIRRLTFVRSYRPVALPPRWVLGAALAAATAGYTAWRERRRNRAARSAGLRMLVFVPCVAVLALPVSAAARSGLLLACLLPVGWLAVRPRAPGAAALGLWVALYALGTSSILHHVTLAAALPLLVAAAAVAEKTSASLRGVAAALLVWTLYLLPGNYFVLNLIEFRDPYILGAAVSESIGATVWVVVTRHLAPAAAAVWLLLRARPRVPAAAVAAAAMAPVLAGAGMRLARLTAFGTAQSPLEAFVPIGVLLLYLVVTGGACAAAACAAAATRRLPAGPGEEAAP